MIRDGSALARDLLGSDVDPRTYLVSFYPGLDHLVPPLDHVVLTARPLAARVNWGIWIASCDCGALSSKVPAPGGVVFFDGPGAALVWCVRCRNGSTGRGWRPVAGPPPAVRAAIEAVLVLRPNVEDRNWDPSETIADLVAQNVERGDPVPGGDDRVSAATRPVPIVPRWRSEAARAVMRALGVRGRGWTIAGRRGG